MNTTAKDKTSNREITTPQRSQALFRFSANRHSASHRVRYVETSNNSQECSLCELSH